MKSFLLIGMGTFGHHFCMSLAKKKHCEIMIVDKKAENLEDLLPYVVSAKVADCRDEKILRTFDIASFDACVVCIGNDFQSSIQITSLLKDLGAKHVIAKAEEDVQEKFLLRNGADQVIYPERDIAERMATSLSSSSIFDFIQLSEDYGIYEIIPLKKWLGKTIRQVDVRNNYNISIVAVRSGTKIKTATADYLFTEDDHLMAIADKATIEKFFK
ncbi:MAG: TrkA family potassium uptake protein [Clostridia bacterium]|nr:TrkA family potassium uptake protein [Clostridia bacterium]